MTESDLAIELGLVKIRSDSFNNTTILNQRLVNHVLSLKKEREEEDEIEDFELAEGDISPMDLPTHSVSVEEKIFELPPSKEFEWEKCEVAIDHPVYKPKKVLSMKAYAIRKFKEMEDELFSEEHFSSLTTEQKESLIATRDAANRQLAG